MKKAVPLPRGLVRAAYAGTCPACFKDYGKGEVIRKAGESWGLPGCAPRQMSVAEREFARKKARIESGRRSAPASRRTGGAEHRSPAPAPPAELRPDGVVSATDEPSGQGVVKG